ncbi:MAG: S-layer homology domain-containing protein [Clostridia bacterium]|nr:S-layer homology domain-containing protein [Clostridia bacterium]
MVKILKRIICVITAVITMLSVSAHAYDVVNLQNSMAFCDALGIFDSGELVSGEICDIDENKYKNLTKAEIVEFYDTAAWMTVWRKINPTPFRGACVNFTTKNGTRISYYFNSGIQIGRYGDENYVCYMPAKADAQKLTYILSDFYDSDDGVYGGTIFNVATEKDFLKLPNQPWAKEAITEAAKKSLVLYEFTDKYEKPITREEMAILMDNFIAVAGNYANMDEYMKATGTVYLEGSFADCQNRDSAIDRLYALGIISGVDGINFNPDGTITRQEAAAFMTRVAKLFMYVGTDYKEKTADWNSVDSWASFYVRWCIDKGLMRLDDDRKVYPKDCMTVEQAITILSRLYDLATYWES